MRGQRRGAVGLAVLFGLVSVLAGCGGGGEGGDALSVPGGDDVACEGVALAFMGALSGDEPANVPAVADGAQVAVDAFNAKHRKCRVELKRFDSGGSPDKAPAVAQQIVDDAAVVGVIGPAFSGEAVAALPVFEVAGLASITPSATNPELSARGAKTFHRMVANDATLGSKIGKYTKTVMQAKNVAVMDDGTTYGLGLSDAVTNELGELAGVRVGVDQGNSFNVALTVVTDPSVEVIFYGGYYADAGRLTQELRAAGGKAKLVFGDGVLDPAYIDAAGPAADGSLIFASSAPADVSKPFAAAYQKRYGTPPPTFAAEGYDAANAFLAAIAAGDTTRPAVDSFLDTYAGEGITGKVRWDANGERSGTTVRVVEVDGNAFVPRGTVD